jgi:hypothetical protein
MRESWTITPRMEADNTVPTQSPLMKLIVTVHIDAVRWMKIWNGAQLVTRGVPPEVHVVYICILFIQPVHKLSMYYISKRHWSLTCTINCDKHMFIDCRCADGRFLLYARGVTILNSLSVSSSETEVGIKWDKNLNGTRIFIIWRAGSYWWALIQQYVKNCNFTAS